ncbi:MAG: leucine-rich repeat domain-containing protein [Clostridia bacterium]|nr:leucine-rich repeat domain-containing protein [Clostridia bacterium]
MEDRKLCMRCMAQKPDEQEACPVCGFIERDFVPEKHHLPPHTILKGQYLVGCALGEGGFGITYIGWDLFLHMPVAIKEYFPSGVVIRDQGQHTVNVFAGKDEQSFLLGRDRFFREAQKVARFDNNPGVVSVKNCFLENGTAYIIMEYISGINLGTYAAQRGGKLGVQETLQLLKTPIQTLDELHRYSTYHRDISPENLMLSKTGTVKLIDFGSAMESDSEKKTRVLMVRSGYSPVEMYSSTGKDGPYSDVYSMAATIYKLITGVTPPAATERLNADSLVRPTMLGVKEISQEQEAALMKGMAVQLNDRYQTMAEFFHDLYGYGINDAPPSKPQPKHRTLLVLLALACVALLVGAGILLGRQGGLTPAPTEQATAEPTEAITAEPTAEPTEQPTAEPTETPAAVADAAWDMPVLGAALRAFLRQNGYDVPDDQPIPAAVLEKVGAVRMFGNQLYFQLLNENGTLDWNDELDRTYRKDGEELNEKRRNQPTGNTLDLAELSGCVNLQYLNLRDVWVSNAQALENLPRVGTLILDNCGVTDDMLPVLGSLASLDSLTLDNNALTTLEGLQALTNLARFSAAFNQISSLAPIYDLSIGFLSVVGNPIASLNELSGGNLVSTIFWFECSPTAGDYSVLAEMTNLERFGCFGSLSDERLPQDFSGLANAKKLDHIYIANCQVKNLDFASDKPNLKTFELWDCGITSDMLSGIHDLPALEMLNLSYNRITYVDNLALETMPNLKTLYLNMNRITGDQLSGLRALPNIDFLDLSWNLITDIDGLALDKMPTLRGLRLNNNSIPDSEALKNIKVDVVYTMGQKDPSEWLSEELRTALRKHLKLADGEWVTQEQLDRIYALTVVNGEVTFHTYDGEIDPNADMLEWLVSIQRDEGDYRIFGLEQLERGSLSDGDFREMSENEFDLSQLKVFRSLRYFHLTNRKAVNANELAGLPLNRLVMVNCGLTDADLVSTSQSWSIADLNLARNQITSLRGFEDHWFGYLGLAFNDVSDLSALSNEMNGMWGLDLSYNSGITSLEMVPTNLKESLQRLTIAGLELDLTPLSEFKSLKELRLGDGLNGRKINLNLEALAGAAGLEKLTLVGAQVDSLDFLRNLTNLRYLTVSGCGVTESMLPALNELTQLEELALENDGLTSLDGVPFERLTKLWSLRIGGNAIETLPALDERVNVQR